MGKQYFLKQYTNRELDSVLLQIINFNEDKLLSINWASFNKLKGEHIDTYYYRCIYLRSFGYVQIEELRDDYGNLYEFNVKLTDLGVRFIADGGFEGKHRREVEDKKQQMRIQIATIIVSIIAIVVSVISLFKK